MTEKSLGVTPQTPSPQAESRNKPPWLSKQGELIHGKSSLSKAVPLVVVLALVSAFLIPGAGSYGLLDPWETHYGEVARSMWDSGDWISPWWGAYWPEGDICQTNAHCAEGELCTATRSEYLPRNATCRPSNIRREGDYFFSKPALSMWMMALGMSTLGLSEFAVRLPFVLSAIFCLIAVFLMAREFFGGRAAYLSVLVLATSPFYFFLARQAVTDTPFVTFATAGLCFFLLAIFGDQEKDRYSPGLFWTFVVGGLAIVIPQILTISFSLGVSIRMVGWLVMVGPIHGAIYTALLVLFAWFLRKPQARTVRSVYLYLFYMCMGLAALAKGLLGFALPGAVIFLYLMLSWDWSLLKRAHLLRGTILFTLVGVPWYASMFARHFNGFFQRFFVHDHFKRLASGVHQIDSGEFDHFILWLGLGSFPWVGFIPATLGRAITSFHEGLKTPAHRVRLFLLLWFAVAFTLFTVSSTQFHHYIFPALPPLAILVACFLDDFIAGNVKRWHVVSLSAILLSAIVGWNLANDPQRLINLFTYRYDREWPFYADFYFVLPLLVLLCLIPMTGLALSSLKTVRQWSVTAMGIGATLFGFWCLNTYLGTLSHTWSQKGMFDAYHSHCTPLEPQQVNAQGRPLCEEDLISYKMNWRGETIYSENTIIPILNDQSFEYYTDRNPDKPFYALVEYRRLQTQLIPNLRKKRREFQVNNIHNHNVKFVVIRIE